MPVQGVSDRQLRGQGPQAEHSPGQDLLPRRFLQLSGEEGRQDPGRAGPRRRRGQDGGAGRPLRLRQVDLHPAHTEVLRPRPGPGEQFNSFLIFVEFGTKVWLILVI